MRRIYREQINLDGFVSWETTYKDTNLFVKACRDLRFEVFEQVKRLREKLEAYIKINSDFLTSLEPIRYDKSAPDIAKKMITASRRAGVGPMASVAGAFAEAVGRFLLKKCNECIVENGGDVFVMLKRQITLGIYTENPFFKDKLNIKLPNFDNPFGVCSSSAKIGPSLSFGKADLAMIIDFDTSFADAMATKTANMIKNESDIEQALNYSKEMGVLGCMFIKGKTIGIWGNLELI